MSDDAKKLDKKVDAKPEPKAVKPEVKAEHKKDPKDAKIEELTNDLKRLQAEFENYKKRSEKECCQFREYSKADIIKKFLPIIDSFELALKNTKNHDEFVKGIELIYSNFYSVLKEEGLEPISAKGKLDPYLHEVLLSEQSDKEEDTIIEELQKGYRFKDKVLRHTKVKVAKK
jgi:molecular chaperone GrpE